MMSQEENKESISGSGGQKPLCQPEEGAEQTAASHDPAAIGMPWHSQQTPVVPSPDQIRSLDQRVVDVLKSCYDPEIPVNIYELGLIYEVRVSDGNDVNVKMTLTSPACPVAESLPSEVEQKLSLIPEVNSAKVELTFDPPWNKDMMSEEAKLELGMW
jgi:FeS assembly SUF system protein